MSEKMMMKSPNLYSVAAALATNAHKSWIQAERILVSLRGVRPEEDASFKDSERVHSLGENLEHAAMYQSRLVRALAEIDEITGSEGNAELETKEFHLRRKAKRSARGAELT